MAVRGDVGVAAWNSCGGGLPWGQPLDQRDDNARSIVCDWPIDETAEILGNGANLLADKAIAGFTINEAKLNEALDKNPILVTAINSIIGYEKGAAIAKQAYKEGRPIREVCKEQTDLTDAELDRLLDAAELTKGGIKG